ncbi:MAG: cyclic nucleotide-binding domain-containing protein [bacterium]|nr:cyclic nucleotide-binding domain-containing protein [bacterium]
MTDSATATMISIYAYTVFLSHYPSSWLIYYVVFQALLTSLLRTISVFFLNKSPKKIAIIQYSLFIAIFILCVLAMTQSFYALPFIVAILISGIAALCSIMCWSLLSLSYEMREYKQVAMYAVQAAYFSAIISSFLIPLLVLFFSNLSILITCVILLIISFILMLQLPIKNQIAESNTEQSKIKPKTIKYPLYYYMLVFTVVMATVTGMSQYLMRVESAVYYTQEQLSSFFGYFSGVTNLIGLFVVGTSTQLLRRAGLGALIMCMPIVCLFSSILIIFFPAFWSVTLLGSIRNIFGFSYGSYAMEVALNILPPSVRFTSKSQIKSSANIFSTLLLLLVTFGQTHVMFLAWLIPPLCCIAIYLAYKIKEYYKITLQQESAFKRYNILDDINPATAPVFKEIAIRSIETHDPYSIYYGLDLLYRLHLTEVPITVYGLVHDPDPAIRAACVDFIVHEKQLNALPFLTQQLLLEKEPSLSFKMVEGIAQLDLSSALTTAKQLGNKVIETILIQISALSLPDTKNDALVHLIQLAQHKDELVRQLVASLIGTFNISELSESLGTLINDPDIKVSGEALRAVARAKMMMLLPQISSQLVDGNNSYQAQLTFISLGAPTLPYLLSQVFNLKLCKSYIKTIAAISGAEAEQTLIAVVKQGHVYYRTVVAKYANKRACRVIVTEEFKQQAHIFAAEECAILVNLANMMKLPISDDVRIEITLRMKFATLRFLDWLAIATRPKEINALTSSLLNSNPVSNRLILDKALELMDIYITDLKTRSYIAYIFDNKPLNETPKLPDIYQDPWLEKIMELSMNEHEVQSPQLSMVFELRAVRLFKDLPAEILLSLAEETQYCSFTAGELIFSENDSADGFYCISQGEVDIVRSGSAVTTIGAHGFFGELALLDEAKRVASAIAKSECSLIFIRKDVFNRIADDVPDVLRTVIKVILEYLRKNLGQGS